MADTQPDAADLPQLTTALDQLIASGARVPLTETTLVREAEVIALLARLRAALPPEVVAVRRLRAECAAIRHRAESEAGAIVTGAYEEVERLVHDTHLLRDTRERADEILRDAQAKADMVRSGADAFAAATLHSYYVQLNDAHTVLERDLTAIDDGIAALRERLKAARAGEPGEGLPLRRQDELLPHEKSVRHEYRVPADETAPLPEPRGGPNSPAPDSPLG